MGHRVATLFTRIIEGEIPGTFVWKDEICVAFMTIQPLKPGHVLVVPRQEVDHWIDVPAGLLSHLMSVAQSVGQAIDKAFDPAKVALQIAGLEVPHLHIHVSPMNGMEDMNFANARDAGGGELRAAAEAIRVQLRAMGHVQVSE